MRVLIMAPMVRIAMRLYLQCLLDEAKAAGASVTLVAPSHVDVETDYPVVHLSGGGALGVLWAQLSPASYIRIAWTMLRGRFDLVHIINGENRPTALWTVFIARLLGVRSAVTIHDPLPHPCARIEVATHRLGLMTRALGSELTILDKAHLDIVSDNSGRPIHIFPVPDIAKAFPKAEPFAKEREVLFFGRMEPYKGIDNFVALGLKMRGEARFVLAGKGDIPEDLMAMMRRNPDIFTIENRYISDEEMIAFMDRAKVALLPYHSATQSGVPPVASARGTLTVGFSLGGLANQIPDVGGVAVPPADMDALEAAVRKGLDMTNEQLLALTRRKDPFVDAARQFYSPPARRPDGGIAAVQVV